MREILFRGKRADNGEWIYGYVTTQFRKYSEGILLTRIQSNTLGVGEHLVDTETVGQYIGIPDKNGVKIFEDDIVDYENTWYSDGTLRGVVAYDEESCMWLVVRNSTVTPIERPDEYITVIGNIHDNPELLNGE